MNGVCFEMVLYTHVRLEVILRGKRYIKINLHISRKNMLVCWFESINYEH